MNLRTLTATALTLGVMTADAAFAGKRTLQEAEDTQRKILAVLKNIDHQKVDSLLETLEQDFTAGLERVKGQIEGLNLPHEKLERRRGKLTSKESDLRGVQQAKAGDFDSKVVFLKGLKSEKFQYALNQRAKLLPIATPLEIAISMSKTIHTAMDEFSIGQNDQWDLNSGFPIIRNVAGEKGGFILGVSQNALTSMKESEFKAFKANVFHLMGMKSKRLVQLVGDSDNFSPTGTQEALAFVKPFFEGDHVIEYGFTGYLTPDRKNLDVNSLLNAYLEDHPLEAERVLANVVGHSVLALEKWGCKVTPYVRNFVMVYNDKGMSEGFTKFGDDVCISDNTMSPDDGDLMVMVEGGPQSFRQSINVLKNNVPVEALYGVRRLERRAFFSATEFFLDVQKALQLNPDLTAEEAKGLMTQYLKTHEAWDPKKNDADTKEKLFLSTLEDFVKDGLYKKVATLVKIKLAPKSKI